VVAERVTELLDVPSLLRAGESYEPAEFQPTERRDLNADRLNADRAES
jgi:hypothetical protein